MTQQTVSAPPTPALSDLVESLSRFQGPPDQFLLQLLAVQVQSAAADGGAIVHPSVEGKPELLAMYPGFTDAEGPPGWARQAVMQSLKVFASGRAVQVALEAEQALYGQAASRHLIMLPIKSGGTVRGVAAFAVSSDDRTALQAVRERLDLTMGLLSLYEMRLTLQMHRGDLARVKRTIETYAAVNEADRFKALAMATCNEVASRWQAHRVAVGFVAGRYVKAAALNHTDKFTRKTQIVQEIERVMEECVDQDVEVLHPAPAEAAYVSRTAAAFSGKHGPSQLCSLPLRRGGRVVGVLTVERPADKPMTAEEIEALRVTCDLLTPRLLDQYQTDRWVGARLVKSLGSAAAAVVGPRHTWVKVAVLLLIVATVLLATVRGPYRVDGTFVVMPQQHRIVAAPFAGYIKTADLEPGAEVRAQETVLMELDTAVLEARLIGLRADERQHRTEAAVATRDGRHAEAQIAEARADRYAAEAQLVQVQIERAVIRAPIDGRIIAGDWRRAIGAPVELGSRLFEIAPLEAMRAEMLIGEDRVPDVRPGMKGQLAAAARPGQYVDFEVESINPVAEVANQRNVFRARVRLLDAPPDWRPGMEGVAKVDVDRRLYAWIWTRGMVNWLRMKLWV